MQQHAPQAGRRGLPGSQVLGGHPALAPTKPKRLSYRDADARVLMHAEECARLGHIRLTDATSRVREDTRSRPVGGWDSRRRDRVSNTRCEYEPSQSTPSRSASPNVAMMSKEDDSTATFKRTID
jgi:hypothetical protein